MTWKDLSELAPQLTEAEFRFERKKRLGGLFLGPVCFVVFLLSPPWEHVTPLGMRSLAIFSWAVVWWITEAVPIPVTSLLVLPLIVICGLWPVEKAFSYWAHWTNMFLIGAFIIGHALYMHGLTRRFSLRLVSSQLVGGSAWRLLVLFLIGNTIVTAFISNTVSAVLFLSMGLGLLQILQIQPGSGYGMAMFLGIAWATNIGGVLTPSGSVPNMLAIGLASSSGYRVGYLPWFLATFPFTFLLVLAMFLVLRLFLRPEELTQPISQQSIREELRRLGPLSRGEKIAAGALAAAITLWILPDLVPLFLGRTHPASVWLTTRLNWGVAAMLVGLSLFVAPIDWKARKFAMTWDEAVKNIEWGTMALVGGALAVGDLVGDKKLGLGEFFSSTISSLAGPETSQYLFLLVSITIAVVLTQVTTNAAIVSVMGPIALAVAPGLGMSPIALLVTIALASNIGYALPMANPPCSIIFASGYVRILPMLLRGAVLALLGILLLSFTGYSVANWALPWPPPQ